eukprot:TRINITY_DN7423_c0_g1_i1.p1 TRINITY_DN7423_c0_g1~~TRINITY_DN7423_c0_g1_i1.p1  ORF type:complete len:383 (+),score=98.72 TRINITY_DN7423_c0_g1_i1:69-1217(+)
MRPCEVKSLVAFFFVAIQSTLIVHAQTVAGSSSTIDSSSSSSFPPASYWSHFSEAFTASFLAILMTELGDRTFFIAVVASMKYSRRKVFLSAISALALMTVLSASIGWVLPLLIPRSVTHYVSTLLFLFFGFRLFKHGYDLDSSAANMDEMEDVETEFDNKAISSLEEGALSPQPLEMVTVDKKKRDSVDLTVEREKLLPSTITTIDASISASASNNSNAVLITPRASPPPTNKHCSCSSSSTGSNSSSSGAKSWWSSCNIGRWLSPIFIQIFVMTFLAEWGDRSQIVTISLASAKDAVGVTIGGIIGHFCCTGLAVLGGKFSASYLSEKKVSMIGGVVFIGFGLYGLLSGSDIGVSSPSSATAVGTPSDAFATASLQDTVR